MADWHIRDSGRLAINRNSHFFLRLLSKLQVLLLMVVFVVTISVANWYILHKFSGICWGSTPSSLVLIFFLIVYRQFHLQFFPFEALFRLYTSGALFDLVGTFYNGTSQTS